MSNLENNLFKTLDESIDKELNKQALQPIYVVVNDAIKTYKQLMQDENYIFSGEYFEEIKGRLLSYTIKRAFDPTLISGNFPFEVNCRKMNFNQRRPELTKNNILLTISQTKDLNELPSKSKYKMKYSKGNSLIARQLIFKEAQEAKIEDIPYYGIIRYMYSDNELKDLDIIIPDVNYKSIIKRIPIPMISEIKKFNEDTNYSTETTGALLQIENLKEQIERDIKDKKIK